MPILLAGLLVGSALSLAAGFSGFDVSNALVPLSEIRSGGPPRDGIPAIDRPRFVSPGAARGLQADDLVVSVTVGGGTRAYPLRILIEVQKDAHSQSVSGVDPGTGQPLPFVKLYWFAWQAFHPQTLLWQP
ncbi:MAG: DUF3179 domain-containing protein [Verrucomicrobia bacterium]|nr:DUF3179 domain-containing protein [Verrucomicrobiota bacterium]